MWICSHTIRTCRHYTLRKMIRNSTVRKSRSFQKYCRSVESKHIFCDDKVKGFEGQNLMNCKHVCKETFESNQCSQSMMELQLSLDMENMKVIEFTVVRSIALLCLMMRLGYGIDLIGDISLRTF